MNDARTYWRCRRGLRELDLILQQFLEDGYHSLGANAVTAFERLLEYPDPLLLKLFMGQAASSDPEIAYVVEKIRAAAAH